MTCGRHHDDKKIAEIDNDYDDDNDDGHGWGDDAEDDSNDKLIISYSRLWQLGAQRHTMRFARSPLAGSALVHSRRARGRLCVPSLQTAGATSWHSWPVAQHVSQSWLVAPRGAACDQKFWGVTSGRKL